MRTIVQSTVLTQFTLQLNNINIKSVAISTSKIPCFAYRERERDRQTGTKPDISSMSCLKAFSHSVDSLPVRLISALDLPAG